jgi:hypothetical protein
MCVCGCGGRGFKREEGQREKGGGERERNAEREREREIEGILYNVVSEGRGMGRDTHQCVDQEGPNRSPTYCVNVKCKDQRQTDLIVTVERVVALSIMVVAVSMMVKQVSTLQFL